MKPKRGDYYKEVGGYSGVYFNGYQWIPFKCSWCAHLDGRLTGRRVPLTKAGRQAIKQSPHKHPCSGSAHHQRYLEEFRGKVIGGMQ